LARLVGRDLDHELFKFHNLLDNAIVRVLV